jgi:hypothetical protein
VGGTRGLGLLSARTPSGNRGLGAYVTLGAGARAIAPVDRVNATEAGEGLQLDDFDKYIRANLGRAVPGLLASALGREGITTCAVPLHFKLASPAMLVAANTSGQVVLAPHHDDCELTVVDATGQTGHEFGSFPSGLRGLVGALSPRHRTVERALLLVVQATPTAEMSVRRDEVPPFLFAEGAPDELRAGSGRPGTLTSDTTRIDGVVSNEDVAPTILDFFDIPIPSEMNGTPIRVVDEAPPFELYERHLAQRRMTIPVSIGFFVMVVVLGVLAVALVARRRGPDGTIDNLGLAIPLIVPSVATAMLAAASLPTFSYAWVIPFLVLAGLAGAALGLAFRRRGPLAPAGVVATGVILFFVVEALRGWPDTLFPLLSGSALDGARFYGLPNVDLGLLLGCGLWVAASLRPFTGFVLLAALGLFAGFPDLGADLGGAVTLLFAGGLWLAVNVKGEPLWRRAAIVVATVAVGTALVILANRYLTSTPTHVTRLAEGAGNRDLLHALLDRLAIGWRLLLHNPFGFIPVVGLPICLWLAVRAPGTLKESFERHPEWRSAMVVLVLASIVAYVVNDTGVAAAGLGFGLALAGILYLPLAERAKSQHTP